MTIRARLFPALLVALLFAAAHHAPAQFGNAASLTQATPSTLAGTWVLKNIAVAAGTPLTPDMQASLRNTRITIEGDQSGKIITNGVSPVILPGKPTVICSAVSSGDFTTATIGNHTYIRVGPAPQTAGKDCGPYAGMSRTYPALSFMYELAGDTFKTFEFAQSGVVIYIYARAQAGFAPTKH